MSLRAFGTLDGVPIEEVSLAAHGIEAKIITWGAVLRDLVVPGREGPRSIVLGLETIEDYVRHSPSFGAIVGRYANRIANGRFPLDGREIQVAVNEGPNVLHSGPVGFGKRPWTLLAHDEARAHLAILSEDGEGGWPGRLFATATYEIVAPGTLRLILQAVTDAPTPVNLSTHSYYNLDGAADVRDHRLQVEADQITPTDRADLPTGEIASVSGTAHDFRRSRPIRPAAPDQVYDMNFVLRRAGLAPGELARAATLSSPGSGIRMELWTSEPGLQVYDGYKVDVAVPGHDGRRYGRHAGLALEPQRFPDGPNHAHFPQTILRPGKVSRQVTELRFGLLTG